MSSTLADFGRLALDAAVDAAWRQWAALGASVGGPRARTALDPEALVLASLALAPHERRLGDVLLWWASVGAPLLSVQRIRSLAKTLPLPDAEADASEGNTLAAFAASASFAGDRRWKRLAGPEGLDARPGKGAERPDLSDPSAVVLRLRAAFGVSAKADLFAVLLGTERPATVRELAEASGYSTVAVRVALGEMVLAGTVAPTGASPAAYRVPKSAQWSALLAGGPRPRWGHWAETFAVLLAVGEWGRRAEGGSPYVASSKARDLVEHHARALRLIAPDTPRLDGLKGEAALPAFAETIRGVARAAASG